MAAQQYEVTQFLLDRANIQDTIELLYLYFDIGEYTKMRTDIFADSVVVDYTVLWGGEPFEVTGEKLTEQWETGLQSKAAAAQHIVSSVVPQLPQPGNIEPPTKAKAMANGSALVKSLRNNVVENTGRLFVDLVRVGQGESNGNPWRISGLKAEMVWQNETPLQQLADDYADYHQAKA